MCDAPAARQGSLFVTGEGPPQGGRGSGSGGKRKNKAAEEMPE